MKLSRESRYAVQGLSYMAGQESGRVLEVARVADATRLPHAFLAKIFRKLTQYGLLTSQTGRGYQLAHPPGEITAAQILEAIEGPDLFQRCVFWSDTCSEENPCPFHPKWRIIRPQIIEAMTTMTLLDLANQQAVGMNRSAAPPA